MDSIVRFLIVAGIASAIFFALIAVIHVIATLRSGNDQERRELAGCSGQAVIAIGAVLVGFVVITFVLKPVLNWLINLMF